MKLIKYSHLRILLLVASLLSSIELYAANPCALPGMNEGGIGGTGHTLEEGIGGTGHTLGDGVGGTGLHPDGGVGGTGRSVQDGIGGTGQKLAVIGIITGFASVCVNGVEVHYDEATSININGQTANASNLMVGQLVSMTAEKTPKGWSANRISTNDAVSGPVTKVVGANRVEVAGQMVNLPNKLTNQPSVRLGQPLRVQGLRAANGEISATSVTQGSTRQTVISGKLDRSANGGLAIGNTQIDGLNAQINPGEYISVTGELASGRMRAAQATRTLEVDTSAHQLSIQSVVHAVNDGVMQLNNGIQIHTNRAVKAGEMVRVVAQKDKNGIWQLLEMNKQTHEELMRRAGKRQQSVGDEEKQDKSGKNNHEDDESDNSGSGNSGSGNSGSGNSGSGNSGSGNSGSGNSGSGNSGSGRMIERSTSGSGSGSGSSGGDRVRVDKPSGGSDRVRIDAPSSGDRIRVDTPSGGDRVRTDRPSGSSGSGRGGKG